MGMQVMDLLAVTTLTWMAIHQKEYRVLVKNLEHVARFVLLDTEVDS